MSRFLENFFAMPWWWHVMFWGGAVVTIFFIWSALTGIEIVELDEEDSDAAVSDESTTT